MKGRWLFIVIAANLVVLVALAFVYPHLMVSPGALVRGHADLATDCFACHAPLRGASSSRCIQCHATADIGLKTTKGTPLPVSTKKARFHQDLIEQDCMACHSDHLGPKLTQRSRKPFSHALLRASVQEQCATCHQTPTDNLHRKVTGGCQQCHSQEAWKPAAFDHQKSFVLDQDHDVQCSTCHKASDYSQYTCYGCHEHTVANVRAEHEKEGIANFDNCVECHRDPGVEPEKKGRTDKRDKRKKD
ncbi:MAG: cytochrome c3 family protein [Rhodoferax sp.]|nr:cytochrome c3 family protein [Rhodoferax sp.]